MFSGIQRSSSCLFLYARCSRRRHAIFCFTGTVVWQEHEKRRKSTVIPEPCPWEAAASGEEETPLYAAIDIHTGKAAKVWSGIKEHHVTADIIYGLISYYRATGDRNFMDQYGCRMILETAVFWYSRAVWNGDKRRFEIRDVIGPDEYTEHVDNNAYTNYMAF